MPSLTRSPELRYLRTVSIRCSPHRHSRPKSFWCEIHRSWNRTDLHRLPPRCHRGALLVELRPLALRVKRRPGGATGNCTPITAVREQYSPLELSPQESIKVGRLRRNRTLSPGFGGPAGHHDSATYELAPRTGIEPVSPHRQWGCDASRITRHSWSFRGVLGRTCTCIDRFRKPAPALFGHEDSASPAGFAPASFGLEDRRLSLRPRGRGGAWNGVTYGDRTRLV